MPFAPGAGTRIYYTESGPAEGRPMLLLHAALQTSESMEPLRELLSPLGLRLIAVDQRGHGRTANPGRSFHMAQLADDIDGLMRHLGLERPLLAGYSLGGIVGIELARRGLLGGLVVLASRIRPARRGRESFAPESIRARSPLWAKQLAERHVEVAWEELAVELGELLTTWPGFEPEELARIRIPLLVVQGDKDQMVSLQHARDLASAVPGARLSIVPRAGHPELLYRAETRERVYEFVRDLLG
ncbi:MAG: alpha/beta fold hydrolase [Bacillota bacterium]